MRHLLRPLILALALASSAAALLHAQEGPDPTGADKAFFRDLKRAVLAGDRAWVAGHVCFPVRAVIEGRTRMIANAEELDAAYVQVMTLETVNAVRRTTPESLVRTPRGVMVGDGEIWLGEDAAVPEGAPPTICIVAFGNAG